MKKDISLYIESLISDVFGASTGSEVYVKKNGEIYQIIINYPKTSMDENLVKKTLIEMVNSEMYTMLFGKVSYDVLVNIF